MRKKLYRGKEKNVYIYVIDGIEYKVIPIIHKYRSNNALAIDLEELNTCETFGRVTINLEESVFLAEDEAFVDINNLPGIEEFIVDYNLGYPTGVKIESGYCTYPKYRFYLNKLNEGE